MCKKLEIRSSFSLLKLCDNKTDETLSNTEVNNVLYIIFGVIKDIAFHEVPKIK